MPDQERQGPRAHALLDPAGVVVADRRDVLVAVGRTRPGRDRCGVLLVVQADTAREVEAFDAHHMPNDLVALAAAAARAFLQLRRDARRDVVEQGPRRTQQADPALEELV